MGLNKLRRMISKREAPDWGTLVRKWEEKASPEWRNLVSKWEKFKYSPLNSALTAREDWNPWKEWDAARNAFVYSYAKTPKSGQQVAFFWSQLQAIASFTADKFDELIALRKVSHEQNVGLEKLRKEKLDLHTQCQYLQGQLAEERQQFQEELEREVVKSRSLALKNMDLQDKFNKEFEQQENELKIVRIENLKLQRQCQELRGQLTKERQQLKEEVKREENKNASLTQTNMALQDKLDVMTAKCTELEYELHQDKAERQDRQLVPYDPNRVRESREIELRPQFGVVGRRSLTISEIHFLTSKLGKITSKKAADWLCNSEDLIQVWGCTTTDFSIILLNCMDSARFSSLPAEIKRGQATWLTVCRHVLESFSPGTKVETIFELASMKRNDSVLQYFRRVWMIYRTMKQTTEVSKEDPMYKRRIWNGLHPHLTNNSSSCFQDYETLLDIVLQAEEEWNPQEESHDVLKAGPGCPSRYKIWKRLENYEDPQKMLDNAPYWKLVVQLARYEDLETGEPV